MDSASPPRRLPLLLAAWLPAMMPAATAALELEPGLYRNAPDGLNALSLGFAYAAGNILVDNSEITVQDARAHLYLAALAYARYWNFFGRTARADAVVPVAWGHFEGLVNGQFLTRDPHGLGDPRFRLTVNLVGAPALDREEFARYQQRTIWALSLTMAAPFGQYDSARLINLGANRWSFRPETGLSQVWGRWCAETAVGAWVFTTNHDYYGGNTQTQAPIEYWKGDIIYSFNKRMWLSFNYGLATGGTTRVNGVDKNDLQTNHQLGGTLTVPVGRQDLMNLVYTKGLATRIGADFNSIAITYSHTWGGR